MPEVVNCPQCERKLRVPEELLGKKVKCPTCGNTFTAEIGPGGGAEPEPPPPPPVDEERPSRRPPRDEDFQEEDRPSRRPARRDDDEDRPRPRRRPSGDYAPHRGTLILVLGIVGLVAIPICGVIAWILGNADLKEIRAGRMDPEGESQTNIGRILGMVATGLMGLYLGCCCIYLIFVVGVVGAGGAAGHR